MNQGLHRVLWSAARGQRMVVAETAASGGDGVGSRGGSVSEAAGAMVSFSRHFGARVARGAVCLATLELFLLTGANAQIKADPNAAGNQRPTILQTANGVPLINITSPSAAGVSRNV